MPTRTVRDDEYCPSTVAEHVRRSVAKRLKLQNVLKGHEATQVFCSAFPPPLPTRQVIFYQI